MLQGEPRKGKQETFLVDQVFMHKSVTRLEKWETGMIAWEHF